MSYDFFGKSIYITAMTCSNSGDCYPAYLKYNPEIPLDGNILLDLVFPLYLCSLSVSKVVSCGLLCFIGSCTSLAVKRGNAFTRFRFCKMIWDPSR